MQTSAVLKASSAKVTLWVWAGPTTSDGRTWYDVGAEGIRGWVAAGVADDPWLVGAASERAPALAVLRLDTCTILCNEVVWYADLEQPSAARLVRRVVDIGLPGGLLDGVRLVAGADELLSSMLRSGLLDETRTFQPQLLPGQVPAGYADDIIRRLVVRIGDGERTSLVWTIPVEPERYEPQPEADGLEDLARVIDHFFHPPPGS